MTYIYGAVILAKPLREFTGSLDECRLSAEVAANPQTKPTDLDCKLRVRQKEMTATVHIHHRHFIITQPES